MQKVEAWMFRVNGEYWALFISLCLIILTAIVLSVFNAYLFVGLAILGLILVKMQQSQYLGSTIRVHKNQYPDIYELFSGHAQRLGVHKGSLFIKQDPTLNAFTIGLSSCSIVLTSALVEQLNSGELSFVIGHELGHFAAGHTKISTFVSPLGNNNWISSLLFGFWQRKTESTADKCGLILTKDIDAGITSLIKLTVGGKLFEKLNIKGYLGQLQTADTSSVNFSQILSDHPFTTTRIKNLLLFWRESFSKT